MKQYPEAKSLPYWKTGTSEPDTWLDKAEKIITELGGQVCARGFAELEGVGMFMMKFRASDGAEFSVRWPCLRVDKETDRGAARRQAATMLYHDVKARALTAKVFGLEFAFLQHKQLPDGRTVGELTGTELPRLAIEFDPQR